MPTTIDKAKDDSIEVDMEVQKNRRELAQELERAKRGEGNWTKLED